MHGKFVGFVVASRLVDNAFYFIKFTKRIKNGIQKDTGRFSRMQ